MALITLPHLYIATAVYTALVVFQSSALRMSAPGDWEPEKPNLTTAQFPYSIAYIAPHKAGTTSMLVIMQRLQDQLKKRWFWDGLGKTCRGMLKEARSSPDAAASMQRASSAGGMWICHDTMGINMNEILRQILPKNTVFFSTLREPLERARSHFYQWHQGCRSNGSRPTCLSEQIAYLNQSNLNCRGLWEANHQTCSLAFRKGQVKHMMEDPAKKAESVAAGYKMLMPLEQLDESLVANFHLKLAIPLEDLAHLRITHHNIGGNPKWEDEPAEIRVLEQVFKQQNKPDYELYRIAQQRHEEVVRESGGQFRHKLQQFQSFLSHIQRLYTEIAVMRGGADDALFDQATFLETIRGTVNVDNISKYTAHTLMVEIPQLNGGRGKAN